MLCWSIFSMCSRLTEMQEDLSIIPLHAELVFTEEFLVLLLFDLCHNVLSFLWRETQQWLRPLTTSVLFHAPLTELQHWQDTFHKMYISACHYWEDLEKTEAQVKLIHLVPNAHTMWLLHLSLLDFYTSSCILYNLLWMGNQHGSSNHQTRRGGWTDAWCQKDWASYLRGSEIAGCWCSFDCVCKNIKHIDQELQFYCCFAAHGLIIPECCI